MKLPSFITNLFRRPAKELQRGYKEAAAVGGHNADWPLSTQTEDADLWQNAYALTARVRDLFRTNPIFIKYRELLLANIFGEAGIMLRMKVKETEDRVVHTPDEKAVLVEWEQRVNRVRKWAAERSGNRFEEYRAFKLADALESRSLESVLRGKAIIEVGAPDEYANTLIERKWREWQRAEFCDVRGRRNYKVLRHLRLISAVRDGDFFIRKIKDPKVNKFGFALQLINAEWCDRFANFTLPNGNEVRLGIEYEHSAWGIGKIVAFYFIKRQPRDWQFTTAGAFGFWGGNAPQHERIDASEIIHYCRAVDAEGTRPAPWCAGVIPKARQLDQGELAEVVAMREAACKIGFVYSDVVPTGGYDGLPIDPRTGLPKTQLGPGEIHALPWGVKYQANNPTHPNGNIPEFRKMMVRSMAAGMPGADYSRLAHDYEAINFSAGRLQSLDTNEIYKLLQGNDIDVAECPINEDWLEMSLITGEIPLPLSKLKKFNKQQFQARSWGGVDEVKEATASSLRIANNISSWSIETAAKGLDFDKVMFEKAEDLMLMDSLGIDSTLTVQAPPPAEPDDNDDPKAKKDEDDEEKDYRETMALHNNGSGVVIRH